MMAFFIYLIKVIICSAIFAGYYWWVLRHGNFYRWNRLYINASVVLSLVIPLLNIPIPALQIPTSYYVLPTASEYINFALSDNIESSTIIVESGKSLFSWTKLALIAYMFVAFILFIKEIVSFIRIVRLKFKAKHMHKNETDLYCIDDDDAPFTFFKTIFWRIDLSVESDEGRCMLRHELAHARHGHSYDKALMQLICCIFWMNPFFFLLRRELELVHEFEADSESFNEDGNTEKLSSLILSTLYPNHYHDLTSRFFQSSIKRRIFMITKSKKTKMGILRKISVIPVVAISMIVCSVNSKTYAVTPLSDVIVEDIQQDENPWTPQNKLEEPVIIISYGVQKKQVDANNDNEVIIGYGTNKKKADKNEASEYPAKRKSPPNGTLLYNNVEIKPQFKQGNSEDEFMKFMTKSIIYPTIAQEKEIKGKVTASYIINENGKVVDIEVVMSDDTLLANEVIRVLKSSTDWIPAKQNGKNVPVQCYFFAEFKIRK
jgi:Antirepressor regulating drug resistance, predicted signal transduction N-terminal membrane component